MTIKTKSYEIDGGNDIIDQTPPWACLTVNRESYTYSDYETPGKKDNSLTVGDLRQAAIEIDSYYSDSDRVSEYPECLPRIIADAIDAEFALQQRAYTSAIIRDESDRIVGCYQNALDVRIDPIRNFENEFRIYACISAADQRAADEIGHNVIGIGKVRDLAEQWGRYSSPVDHNSVIFDGADPDDARCSR